MAEEPLVSFVLRRSLHRHNLGASRFFCIKGILEDSATESLGLLAGDNLKGGVMDIEKFQGKNIRMLPTSHCTLREAISPSIPFQAEQYTISYT